MVDYARYEYRSPTHGERLKSPLFDMLHRQGRDPKLLIMKYLYATPAADTEIRTSFTNILDGIATPVVIDIKSSDNTQDKASGTGALTIGILGISGSSATATDFKLQEEIITLTGTTSVTTTKFYKRVIGTRTVTAGSGKDPVGNITTHEEGGTTNTYSTQTAAYNWSINARVYAPSGYDLYLFNAIMRRIPTTNTAVASLTDGGIVTLKLDDSLLTQQVVQKFDVLPTNNENKHVDLTLTGDDDSYITFSVQAVDQDVTTAYLFIQVSYLIYATSLAARGY